MKNFSSPNFWKYLIRIDLKAWTASWFPLKKCQENNSEREIWSDPSFMFARHTSRTLLPDQNIHRERVFAVAPVFTSTLQCGAESGWSERGHTFTKDHVYAFPESPARTGSRFVAHVVRGAAAPRPDRYTANPQAWAWAAEGAFLFSFWLPQGRSQACRPGDYRAEWNNTRMFDSVRVKCVCWSGGRGCSCARVCVCSCLSVCICLCFVCMWLR